MTSAFGSFTGSALGARVQSSVDAQAFGGTVIVAELIAHELGVSEISVGLESGVLISCNGNFMSYIVLAGDTGPTANPPDAVKYKLFSFYTSPSPVQLFDDEVWRLQELVCNASPGFTVEGQTSGKIFTGSSHSLELESGLPGNTLDYAKAGGTHIQDPAQNVGYTIAAYNMYTLGSDANGDIRRINAYVAIEDFFDDTSVPSDFQFINGETVTVSVSV